MKNFLIAFLVFLVWSFFGLWLYSWLDPIGESAKNEVVVDSLREVDANDLILDEPLKIDDRSEDNTLTDSSVVLSENIDDKETVEIPKGLKAVTPSGDLIFLFDQGISFTKNGDDISISAAIKDFKYKLNTYSIEHPNEELHIASLYSASENIESPNLGLQRGDKIASLLVDAGLSREKIVIKPVIRDLDFGSNNSSPNGISFSFHPLDAERVASIKMELPENKNFYPKLVNNDIFVNEALEELMKEAQKAIADHPNLKIRLVGHTDNVGNANDNYQLGLKYSRQVKWYLTTKGKIDRTRILAVSEGESQSIASNKTDRGRFLNTRVEVIYQNN